MKIPKDLKQGAISIKDPKRYSELKERLANLEKKNPSQKNKIDFLARTDREYLTKYFDNWEPKKSPQRRRGAPLDQRISLSITKDEKEWLVKEVEETAKHGPKISISKFVRNKTIGTLDINDWREKATENLQEIETIEKDKKNIQSKIKSYKAILENSDDLDDEDELFYNSKINDLDAKLLRIKSVPQKRTVRLVGRMTTQEAETIKWRAQRLCLSTSDFLRMVIFNYSPDSPGDKHMSFESKVRFYVSVIDVSSHGWGDPPNLYNCRQCETYLDELEKTKKMYNDLEKEFMKITKNRKK